MKKNNCFGDFIFIFVHCICICTLTLSQQDGSVLEYIKGVVVLHRCRIDDDDAIIIYYLEISR